jgi:hypothetical protein
MPTHNRLRPDDCYGVKNAREAAIEPNEQGTVNPTQLQSAWGALLQVIEVMSQSQDFGFCSRCRGLKRSHSNMMNRLAFAMIRRSCSDLLLTASREETVFGSDSDILRWKKSLGPKTQGFVIPPQRPYKPLLNKLRTLDILIACHRM